MFFVLMSAAKPSVFHPDGFALSPRPVFLDGIAGLSNRECVQREGIDFAPSKGRPSSTRKNLALARSSSSDYFDRN